MQTAPTESTVLRLCGVAPLRRFFPLCILCALCERVFAIPLIENGGWYERVSGVLSKPLTDLFEAHGKQWVSEIECSRNINWYGEWRRVDAIAAELRGEHPESFRPVRVRCRNGEVKEYWAFTKVVRLKRYGKKRLVIVHEQEDLQDTPRFLLTSAHH